MGIEAFCGWGEGPDVGVTFKDHIFVLSENPQSGVSRYGVVKNGWTDLTAEEAKILAHRLLECARYAEELDRSYEEHSKYHASLHEQETANKKTNMQRATSTTKTKERNDG